MKAGNVTAANNIPKGTLGTSTGVGRNAANELSLIDFDPEPSHSAAPVPAQNASNGSLLEDTASNTTPAKQTTVEDDLLGLSLGSAPPGSISLGGSTLSDLFKAPQPSSSQPYQQTQTASFTPASVPTPSFSPGPTSATAPSSKPNYDAFASLSSALPRSKPATPTPGQQRPSASMPISDPFATLVSSGSRPSTPSMQQNGARQTSGSFQPSGLVNTSAQRTNVAASTTTTTADDEWDFVSSPPAQEPALPTKSTLTVLDQGKVKIVFECMRQTNQGPAASAPVFIKASFTNQTTTPVSALHFQIAVEKSYTLQLQPQSGKELPPQQPNAITQNMLVSNVPPGKGTAVKIRFKVSYSLAGAHQEEQGMVTSLGIS